MSAPQRNHHRCPAPNCLTVVPDRLFACTPHWHALSEPVRSAIYATAKLIILHPDRRAAIEAAREEWR